MLMIYVYIDQCKIQVNNLSMMILEVLNSGLPIIFLLLIHQSVNTYLFQERGIQNFLMQFAPNKKYPRFYLQKML